MTNQVKERAAEPIALGLQLEQLVRDLWLWVMNHTIQIMIGAAMATLIVLFLLGVKAIGVRIWRSDPDHTRWRSVFGKILAKTKFWFMVALAARLVAGYAQAPGLVASTFNFFFVVAAALQVAIWARELILGIVEHRVGGADEASGLGSALSLIRVLVSVSIFAIALIVILDNLGVNVTGLVAGLGIGGIAIGLAAQGIFSDLFAALSIIFDKPFRRGDAVSWDQTQGTVEKIGLKSTRVRALTGEQVIISNANLLNKELRNSARLYRRRIVQQFGITYQTKPEVCVDVPRIVGEIVNSFDNCSLVRCGMVAFGASSLDYELQFDVMSEDYEEVFQARHCVLIAILRAFNERGIEFAYPTQTTFTAAPDGKMIMPYAPVTMIATDAEDDQK